MEKGRKVYLIKRMLALVLAVAMTVGMAPATVYAAPDEGEWTTETGESATVKDSDSTELQESVGVEDTEDAEPEESAEPEGSESADPEKAVEAEQSSEDTEPDKTDDPIYDGMETEESLSNNTLSDNVEVQAEDAENIIASGIGYANNDDLKWTLYKSGELVVEGTGEFAAYEHGPSWLEYSDLIESATVKVTGAASAYQMFAGCKNLKTIDLKGFETQNIKNMQSMFGVCTSLTSIDLSSFHTENVTSMLGMFSGCSSLTTLDLSCFHTQQVVDMRYMFLDCSALTTLDMSNFTISSDSYADEMFRGCESLREIKTPRLTDRAVKLPETSEYYSWRTEDGTKVTELPAKAATVSIGKKIGISFTGSNFTLKEFGDKKIEDIDVVFDKGGKESFTFTVVPEKDHNVAPTVEIMTNLTKITVTQGDSPYQYIVTPKNAEQGYQWDEVIDIRVAKPEKYTLELPAIRDISDRFSYSIYQDIAIVNGEEERNLKSDLTTSSYTTVEVSNEFDTTIYVKPWYDINDKYQIPLTSIGYINSWYSKTVKGEAQVDSPTETDKKYIQDGYLVLRLGKIYDDARIGYWGSVSPISLNLITEGFPEGCRIIGYHVDPSDGVRCEEREYDEEITLYQGEEFFVQVKWTDIQNAYRWYRPQVSVRRQGNLNDTWSLLESATAYGIEGKVWKIDTGSSEDRDLLVALKPYEIKLEYQKGDLIDFDVSDGAKLSEDETKLEVMNGDSLSMSFGLSDGLSMNGISVMGENGSILTNEKWISFKENENNKWTFTVNDMSKLYDIKEIKFDIKDELGRISLSDPENRVYPGFNTTDDFNNSKKRIYNGQPVYPKKGASLYVNGVRLTRGTDYTVAYQNNVNAGVNTAAIIFTAAKDSPKYRGEYIYYFSINKANPFSIPETQLNIEAGVPSIDLAEKLVVNATYDKNVKPTSYSVVSCQQGGIFAKDPEVAADGHTLRYYIREDADRNSEPAKITLRATMENYKDTNLVLKVRLVKREWLILEGELAEDKVYDGKASYPNISKLQILQKYSGSSENEARPVDAEETAKIREKISGTLICHYIGINGTVYDDYKPPVDVGNYKLEVKVSEENEYYKSNYFEAGTFQITPRDAVLKADDVTLYLNDTIPAGYDYIANGLAWNDAVSAEPVLSCTIPNTATAGEYPVQINVTGVRIVNTDGKDVTANYRITGEAGTLHVEMAKAGSCTVIFNLLGKGTDIRRSGIEAGSLISKPIDPTAAGYVFHGWYVDETFSKMWDFTAGTIQKDMTLYAGWSSEANPDLQLHVREILPQTYTGKALKPTISVYAADGKTLLKSGKDYSIVYKNNVDADTKKFSGKTIPNGGIGSSVTDTGAGFDAGLAYVVITGKGNYKGTVCMNFHIAPADISGAGNAGSAMTLKYTEAFEAKAGKNAAIVTQLKSKTAALKYGRDYTLTVKKTDGAAVNLTDKGQLPLGAGTYKLTIEGKDNYTGSVEKDLYVAAKEQLIRNAKIKCVSTISDVTKGQLQAGIEPQNLEVTLNGTPLEEGTDFEVICTGNHAIGTATVTVKGIGEFFGSKSTTFKIKGIAFKEKEFGTVIVQDKDYTGTALTQNDVALTKNGTNLIYGEDYTISYKNNIKKGKATMTFTANPASGYSGSFKKTFKINPLNLNSTDILLDGAEKNEGDTRWTLSESVPYQKGGATPTGEFALKLRATNVLLTAGKDYGIKYKDNANVSNGTAYMTFTGKGNFTGSILVYFDIRKASLSELYQEKRVTITSKSVKASMSYTRRWDSDIEDWDEQLKAPDYEFKPSITVKDGKKALKKDVDYVVTYKGNVRSQLEYGNGTPQATITGIGNYSGTISTQDLPITIPLSIYHTTLSGSRVYVVYDANTDYTYTGEPITPKVSVYYGKAADVKRAKKNMETDESVLTRDTEDEEPKNAYGLTKLSEYAEGNGDYVLSYGANTAKGKTGKVIISGVYDYSGSVTSTFAIAPKEIYRVYEEPDSEE